MLESFAGRCCVLRKEDDLKSPKAGGRAAMVAHATWAVEPAHKP